MKMAMLSTTAKSTTSSSPGRRISHRRHGYDVLVLSLLSLLVVVFPTTTTTTTTVYVYGLGAGANMFVAVVKRRCGQAHDLIQDLLSSGQAQNLFPGGGNAEGYPPLTSTSFVNKKKMNMNKKMRTNSKTFVTGISGRSRRSGTSRSSHGDDDVREISRTSSNVLESESNDSSSDSYHTSTEELKQHDTHGRSRRTTTTTTTTFFDDDLFILSITAM
jgi:hypothetical protein